MSKIYTDRGVCLNKKVIGGQATFTIQDMLNGGSDLKAALVDVCAYKGTAEEDAWAIVDEVCRDIHTIIQKAEADIRKLVAKPFPNTGDRYDAVIEKVTLTGTIIAEYFIPYWEHSLYERDENGQIREGEVIKKVPAFSGVANADQNKADENIPNVDTNHNFEVQVL